MSLAAVLDAQATLLESRGREAMAQAQALRRIAAEMSSAPAQPAAVVVQAPAGSRYLRVREVAEAYGIRPGTVRVWVRRGLIPRPELVGGSTARPRWRADVIEAAKAGRAS